VHPLVRQRQIFRTVKHDEGELRQIDPMDLHEELLPVPGETAWPPLQVLDQQQAQDHFHQCGMSPV
jgi:hypothetical protein